MSIFQVVGLSILGVIVVVLIFIVIKSTVAPKKADVLPRLLSQGKTQNVIKLSKSMIAKNPSNYVAHYYLGKAYYIENKPELALMEYKTVNENALFGENLNELEFRKEFSEVLMKTNQSGEALKNFLLLTKMEPKNAENFYNVGCFYEKQNRYDIALGFMQKAVAIDKRHAKAHAQIGLMLYRTKQFGEAKKEIDIALKLSPETYSSYYYLGKILKDAKDIQGAIKAFEKAQRDPEFKQKSIIERGSCYMIVNRLDNAVPDFQRAIDLDKNGTNPETLFARYFLAACYEKTRKIEKAIEQWELIYKKNKGFKDVSAKLSEYKDLQANDYLKDYLTCSDENFQDICQDAISKGLNLQILSCEQTKWGCQITAVDKRDDFRMSVRKMVMLLRFYREPNPLNDSVVREILDEMKAINSVKSFIFSSSSFTTTAKKVAEGRPVELIEKDKLETILTSAGKK